MTVSDAPTEELGTPGGIAPTFTSGLGNAFYVEGLESNVDLRFPASTIVYDRMRNEDGQVGSVVRAVTNPILATKRRLVGSDVRPEVIAFLENELGLNIEAGRARRRREGIVLSDHLREAMLSRWFGFMPFEQVYSVGRAAPGLEDPENPNRLYAHLRKLAPRMPRTLTEVRVARDGGLAGIVQAPPPGASHLGGNVLNGGVFIPVDRLVMYVNEREGAEWTGKSLLRASYKHWLIKDALIRLGAQIVERNGMGIPFVNYTEPSDRAKAVALAKALRAGAEAGGALGPGMSVSIVGVTGTTSDELPRVKYHDESIGRSLLAMFLNLGHDNGAKALGDTFVNMFRNSLGTINRDLDETVTEHIIRDLVELNYGVDEPYPTLVSEDLSEDLTAEALKALKDAGLLTYDEELEGYVRNRYGLPKIDPATRPVVAPETAVPQGEPDADVIPFPEQTAATAIETGDYRLDPEGLTGDILVDQLSALVGRVAALRAGHRSTATVCPHGLECNGRCDGITPNTA